jgi:pterin-4a-carbinolamine dehydratase
MDLSTISPGARWPDRIREEVKNASVMLVLIGPHWLTVADSYGKRRIDDKNDWVRNELLLAFAMKKEIIPVLLAGVDRLPVQALPKGIEDLANRQVVFLRDENWEADLHSLISTLVEQYGFIENESRVEKPIPGSETSKLPALTKDEFDRELSMLPGWNLVESAPPGEFAKSRFELRKAFKFATFAEAIAFMHEAVKPINEMNHHPRWQNEWTTVTIWLSTWDIGNKITILDVELARTIETLYSEFLTQR